jgi:pyruvate-formate lyase-activating enzyme
VKKINIAKISVTPKNIIDPNLFAIEIYVCGCSHNCAECHNPSLKDFDYKNGTMMSVEEILEEIKKSSPICDLLIFMGGDFGYYLEEMFEISKMSKSFGLSTVLYTGFEDEEIPGYYLSYIDFVLYGKYNPLDPDKKKQFKKRYLRKKFKGV